MHVATELVPYPNAKSTNQTEERGTKRNDNRVDGTIFVRRETVAAESKRDHANAVVAASAPKDR